MNDLFKPHQCPRCFGLFEVGDRFWNDGGTVYHLMCWINKTNQQNKRTKQRNRTKEDKNENKTGN